MVNSKKMVRFSARTVVLVALALIVSSVQCAAACTPVSCEHPQPPCHHHKPAPANQKSACSHELVPATVQPSTISISLDTVDAPFIAGVFVSPDLPVVQNQSPPGVTVPLSSVLKI